MTRDEQRLLRHLVIAVTVKLALLTALWWLFVRDDRVHVDADQTAAQMAAHIGAHMGNPSSPPGVPQ
ncbi:MAG: hypothetical protein JHC40_20590 [Burkholderiales bacterium]|jgi:hypothetical protein|nr:hypothetical protein [Burkholderiales bacterium]